VLIKDIMQTQVVSATTATPMSRLARVLQRRGFRHIPILDDGKLVGIVSDRDIKQAMASAAQSADGAARDRLLEELTAGQIMTRAVTTIGPMFGVEDAARLMATGKFSALPVTEGDRLVGIVTETDVLLLLVRALGVLEPSSRVDVRLGPGDPALGGVVHAVEGAGARITSVVTLEDRAGGREVALRLGTIDPRPSVDALRRAGYRVLDR
jgi:acetoin utilization protein AcuB